ncbi:MoaD/ThiS family protein [Sanguibacter suaedae]|uniref:MoaD/ThiS family protein n=1 Tax=Sanguibacter suaedae TaxID=2795737 RepID=A0A934I8U0_9MICO|nr:MoaD/ThiS family protein [Sanguibacter suaedae]MBI9115232.1 MoaD/ThiS family protein [Sanguibacter suaedae]
MAESSTRTVRVRYYAAAAEAAGRTEETVDLAGSTVGDLKVHLRARYGAPMSTVLARASFLVDSRVTREDARPLGATVDVLPPFAGG